MTRWLIVKWEKQAQARALGDDYLILGLLFIFFTCFYGCAAPPNRLL